MNISVLLCTWNNAERLAKTLAHIATCRIPEDLLWELLVVNNNCTDHTDSVVQRFIGKLPIVLLHEPKQGLSRARNAGLVATKGDWILFTDDDVRPCKEWIAAYWAAILERGEHCYFGGPVHSDFEGPQPHAALLKHAPGSVKGVSWGESPRQVQPDEPRFISANWAAPTKSIRAAGGFNESMGLGSSSNVVSIGEETNLMTRLEAMNMSRWYLPDAQIWHFVPKSKTTLKHIAARKEAAGYYWERYQSDHDMDQVPAWMVKVTLRHLLQCCTSLRTSERLDEYLAFRLMFGRIRGLRARFKSKAESLSE